MPHEFEPDRGDRVIVQKLIHKGSEVYQLKFYPGGMKTTHFVVVGRVLPEQPVEQYGKERDSYFDSLKDFKELRDKILKYHDK